MKTNWFYQKSLFKNANDPGSGVNLYCSGSSESEVQINDIEAVMKRI